MKNILLTIFMILSNLSWTINSEQESKAQGKRRILVEFNSSNLFNFEIGTGMVRRLLQLNSTQIN